MVNLNLLAAELVNDPLERGYAAMSDAESATSLNTVDRSRFVAITADSLLEWAAGGAEDGSPGIPSRLVRIQQAAAASGGFTEIGHAAQGMVAAALTAINSGRGLGYHKLAVRGMVAALVAAGVLSQYESNELATRGTESVSRATEIGLGSVRTGDITAARAL